jgi:hypothetical protein
VGGATGKSNIKQDVKTKAEEAKGGLVKSGAATGSARKDDVTMKAALPSYLHYLLSDGTASPPTALHYLFSDSNDETKAAKATKAPVAKQEQNQQRQQRQHLQQLHHAQQQEQEQHPSTTTAATAADATTSTRIPRVVHFVISDRGTRYFDWTAFVAVVAAARHIKPKSIKIHVLDGDNGGAPIGQWWAKLPATLATMGTPLFIIPFGAKDVPQTLNNVKVICDARSEFYDTISNNSCFCISYVPRGVLLAYAPVLKVTIPAHLSDFKRFKVLLDEGGMYMDTDHVRCCCCCCCCCCCHHHHHYVQRGMPVELTIQTLLALIHRLASYMFTQLLIRDVDELLVFDSVWGRQAKNENGHQV